MNIQPLGDYVFLVKKERGNMASGIILLDTTSNEYTVYGGGGFEQGATVVVSQNATIYEVTVDGNDYIVVDKKDILCTL